MADSEIIIRLLEKVERRLRTNRLFEELTSGLTFFLVFPVALKIWDLFFPLTAKPLAVLVGAWLISLAGYSAWRVLQQGTLSQVAASIDKKAGLCDEIKTAFWFINNPRPSEWIDVLIQRAAKSMRGLDVNRLYPRSIPRTSYLAATMILVFVGLNFVPASSSHNWLTLQAAPAVKPPTQQVAKSEVAEEIGSTEKTEADLDAPPKDVPQEPPESQPADDEIGGLEGGILTFQFEQQRLDATPAAGSTPDDYNPIKSSKSKLNYRAIRSEIEAAKKDRLNQDHLPWEYRSLIKDYFQAMRPPNKK